MAVSKRKRRESGDGLFGEPALEPCNGSFASFGRIIVIAGVPVVTDFFRIAESAVDVTDSGVIFFFHRAAFANGLPDEQGARGDESGEFVEGKRQGKSVVEDVGTKPGQGLTIAAAFGNGPMHSVMEEVGDRAVGDGDFDARFKSSGEDSAVTAVGVASHADFFRINEIERLEVIDGAPIVPDVFAVNRPVGELFVEISGIVRAASWLEAVAVAEVISSKRDKAGLDHVDGEPGVAVGRRAGRATGKADGGFFACAGGCAVKADDGGNSRFEVVRDEEICGHAIAGLNLD